jgi:hypothetical protein
VTAFEQAFAPAFVTTSAGHVIEGAVASRTVTLKEHEPVLDAASVAVQVTVVAPTGKVEPEAGEQTTEAAPEQLSEADGVSYSTKASHCPVGASASTFAGHAITGPVVSETVTVKEQEPVLEAASVAVQVTVVVPTSKVEPEAGLHTTEGVPQLSEAEGVANVTTAEHASAVAERARSAGQVTTGGVVSATETVKEQEAVFPPPSVAVQVTVVAPSGKVDPEAGTHETVAEPQSSVAVGVW